MWKPHVGIRGLWKLLPLQPATTAHSLPGIMEMRLNKRVRDNKKEDVVCSRFFWMLINIFQSLNWSKVLTIYSGPCKDNSFDAFHCLQTVVELLMGNSCFTDINPLSAPFTHQEVKMEMSPGIWLLKLSRHRERAKCLVFRYVTLFVQLLFFRTSIVFDK